MDKVSSWNWCSRIHSIYSSHITLDSAHLPSPVTCMLHKQKLNHEGRKNPTLPNVGTRLLLKYFKNSYISCTKAILQHTACTVPVTQCHCIQQDGLMLALSSTVNSHVRQIMFSVKMFLLSCILFLFTPYTLGCTLWQSFQVCKIYLTACVSYLHFFLSDLWYQYCLLSVD